MNSKHIITGILLSSLTAPIAFAESNQKPPLPRGLMNGDFCTNIADITSIEDFAKKEMTTRSDKAVERENKRLERRNENENKRNEKRTNRQGVLSEKADQLISQATTEEQKKAIEQFVASVKSAEQIKTSSIDEILAKTKAEVDAIIKSKQQNGEIGFEDLKATIDTAFAKAKSDCASGVDSQTALETFKTTIKNSHEAFRDSNIQNKIKDELQETHESRKAEISSVQDEFKNSVETAKEQLKSTFPEIQIESNTGKKIGLFAKIKNWFRSNAN